MVLVMQCLFFKQAESVHQNQADMVQYPAGSRDIEHEHSKNKIILVFCDKFVMPP